ncbi:MAG: RNA methyltransferase [Gammaproteobacteria bacterium]|nr:RNA methyltransferase [Gammaproteobacteria bacterium]MYC26050.1 RNA methyltransferase [Gammaproteobacteria bacterium]
MPDIRIVLVEPSHPGNIGGAARAMKTMGLSSLALVNPKRFPDPQADWRAAGALDIVEKAQVYDTISAAVKDSVLVAGTSARTRHIPWPMMTSAEFAEYIHSKFKPKDCVSVLFGREDNGLTNDELNLCNRHIRIPSSDLYGSLNLAMSVQIVAYDLFCQALQVRQEDSDSETWDKPLATFAEVNDFLEHLQSVLLRVGFSDPEEPRKAEIRLRRLFGRIDMDHTEVQILRGILTHIEKGFRSESDLNDNAQKSDFG